MSNNVKKGKLINISPSSVFLLLSICLYSSVLVTDAFLVDAIHMLSYTFLGI